MTPTLLATDNAPTTEQPPDTRRITESDADYQRLHARTVRKLTASIAQFVRELRRGEQGADSRFIHRHTGLLRDAYLAAHEAGQRDYWQSVSLRHDQPTVDPDPLLVQQRLSYFAAGSVLKMAQQGNAAKMAAGGHITQGEPSERQIATTVRLEGIYLAGGDPDPLAAWQASTDQRVNLQGAIAWSGIQDGYLKGGVGDPANPFALLYWNLGIVKGDHCDDCKRLAFSSPYNAPGSGGNELYQTPGDGRTECGANCKCDLSYTPLAPLHEAELRQAVQQAQSWLDYQNQLRAQSLVPEGFTAQPGGGSGLPTFQPLWRQPGYGGNGALLVPPNTTDLATAQKAALDAIRSAQAEWERVRADHPDLPADPWYFSDNPGDPYAVPTIVASGTYEYAEEYAALRRLWDAQGLWLAANGVEPSDLEMAEFYDGLLSVLLGGMEIGGVGRTYERDAKGRFAFTGGRKPYERKGRTRAAKDEQPTGGRGKGGGGSERVSSAKGEHAAKVKEEEAQTRGQREASAMHRAVVAERSGGRTKKGTGTGEKAAGKSTLPEPKLTEKQFDHLFNGRRSFSAIEGQRQETWRASLNGHDYFIKQASERAAANEKAVFTIAERLGVAEHYVPTQVFMRGGKTYEVQPWVEGAGGHTLRDGELRSSAILDKTTRIKLALTDYIAGDVDRAANNMLIGKDGVLRQFDYESSFRHLTNYTPDTGHALLRKGNESYKGPDAESRRVQALKVPHAVQSWLRDTVVAHRDALEAIGREAIAKANHADIARYEAALKTRLDAIAKLAHTPNATLGDLRRAVEGEGNQ